MQAANRPLIVHVSADYPDAVDRRKTPVIARLVELAGDAFHHKVISLNRRAPPKWTWGWPQVAVEHAASDSELDTLIYTAPPAGIHHRRMLRKLGEALAERIAAGPRPDLLIAHKLTIEGIAVSRAAELLGLPYAVLVQGNTDERVLRMRPDLHRFLRPIYHGAAHVFPFTPWAQRAVEQRLGQRSEGVTVLPCPMAHDTMIVPKQDGNGLVTAFHLRNAKLKNLPRMANALTRARKDEPNLALSVIGGGSPAEMGSAHTRATAGLTFEGPIPNDSIAARFNAARGFVLPSQRESFGLVFIEALFAGLPIAYPRGAAVDGYFEGCPFAIAVDASDTSAIASAMTTLHHDETRLKAALVQWQQSPAAQRFTRPAIGAAFRGGLKAAMTRGAPR